MTPKFLKFLDFLALILILSAAILVFAWAPVEVNMGMVQKVFYFHVAYAWIGMLSFLVAAASSIAYLSTKQEIMDHLAESSVEIGMMFSILAVASGSIWARPIWNTWWTWDPRLTTTTIMIMIYVGYLFLRKSLEHPDSRKKITAAYCIAGCLSVPLTFFSIRGARSIHPVIVGSKSGTGMNMTAPMFQTMIFSICAFSILYISLLWHKSLILKMRDEHEMLAEKIGEAHD